jgi:hypothetical protein
MTGSRVAVQTGLVPGRQCGACTVCCKILPVNVRGLQKTANVLCRHVEEGQGCRIYSERPGVCRSFYCEWRLNPQLPATWRPDKCAIFIQRIAREHIDNIPEAYASDHAVAFMLLSPESIDRPAVVEAIAQYIYRRIPVFLAIPGPAGYLPAQIFLNERMERSAAARDLHGMRSVIKGALEILTQDGFERVPEFG